MKTPPLLIGISLLVWGWQVELFGIALGLAVLLEVAYLLTWRWSLQTTKINRVGDGCSFAVLLLIGYAILSYSPAGAILAILKWLPLCLFPLIAIQYYSDQDKLPLTALSLQHRRRRDSQCRMDISHPYFVACLISASTGNRAPVLFYLIVFALWAWTLWLRRNPRFALAIWMAMMLLGGSGGFVIYSGLSQAHSALEEQFPAWLLAWFEPQPDPYQRSTALGSIGSLKLSSRIVLRVTATGQREAPGLLRMASYNLFDNNFWFTSRNAFTSLARQPLSTWNIRPSPKTGGNTVTILQQVGNDKTLLPLPLGAYQIRSLEASRVEGNFLGTIQATEVPATLQYNVAYYPAAESLSPVADDLSVPFGYNNALADIAAALGLSQLPVQQVPEKLQTYFNEQFDYSLVLKTRDTSLPPLIDFLRNTRSGHCEYFASATVLLLRQVGIPARYASGFSVQEYSPLENRFIVRKRHAHAWAIAYLNGRWQNVDTTPAIWREADAQQDSLLIGLYDVLSWGWLQIQQWLTKQEKETSGNPFAWLLLALCLLLVGPPHRQLARLWLHRRTGTLPGSANQSAGRDSECYRIADWCLSRGLVRTPGETLERWLKRNASVDANSDALLTKILALHARYRFDPAGLSSAERTKLRDLVEAWFQKRTRQQNPLRKVISKVTFLTLFALIILFIGCSNELL